MSPDKRELDEAVSMAYFLGKDVALGELNRIIKRREHYAVQAFIDQMLVDEAGNDEAGHRWSRGDFIKYLHDFLTD